MISEKLKMYHIIDIIDIVEQLIAIVNALPDFESEEERNITREHIKSMLIDILHQLWFDRDI